MRIVFSKDSKKIIKKQNKLDCKRLIDKCFSLLKNPFPTDSKRIVHPSDKFYRIRAGKHRILYKVENELILIIRIDKRSKIYDKL